jgi:hypothetical protein
VPTFHAKKKTKGVAAGAVTVNLWQAGSSGARHLPNANTVE